MMEKTKQICNNIIVSLEGGYILKNLVNYSEVVVRSLLNEKLLNHENFTIEFMEQNNSPIKELVYP